MSTPAASWETSRITLLSTFNKISAADRSEVPILFGNLLTQSNKLVSDLERQPSENSEMLLTAARTFVAAQQRLSEVTHSVNVARVSFREPGPDLEKALITALETVDTRLKELVFAKISMLQTPRNGGASAPTGGPSSESNPEG